MLCLTLSETSALLVGLTAFGSVVKWNIMVGMCKKKTVSVMVSRKREIERKRLGLPNTLQAQAPVISLPPYRPHRLKEPPSPSDAVDLGTQPPARGPLKNISQQTIIK